MSVKDIFTKQERQPFRPFIIELVSGSTIYISSETEILFPRKRPELVIVFTEEGIQHEFEEAAIARISEAS